VSVTIQGPKGVYYGGYLGGPVFKEVMSYTLQSRNIPPTGESISPYALTYKDYQKKILIQAGTKEKEGKKEKEKTRPKKVQVDAHG
jgi:hypothetical protein